MMKKLKNSYSYIDHDSYLHIKNYYKNFIMKKYKELSLVDKFLVENEYNCFKMATKNDFITNKTLEFKLSSNQYVQLNAFESYVTVNYELINLCEQILSLDWCYSNDNQYLSICTLPMKNLLKFLTEKQVLKNEEEINIEINYEKSNKVSNLIYFYKTQSIVNDDDEVNCLNSENLFEILNRNLGNCYELKWRPDCGVVQNLNKNLLGYLLVTSTNGYAYIYLVENLFKNECIDKKSINIYEPTHEIRLKVDQNLYGQCITGDWCQ